MAKQHNTSEIDNLKWIIKLFQKEINHLSTAPIGAKGTIDDIIRYEKSIAILKNTIEILERISNENYTIEEDIDDRWMNGI